MKNLTYHIEVSLRDAREAANLLIDNAIVYNEQVYSNEFIFNAIDKVQFKEACQLLDENNLENWTSEEWN